MPQFKTTHNGAEIQVEIPDDKLAEAGFLSTAQVSTNYVPKANVESIIQGRLAQEPPKIRKQLAEDAEFRKEILTSLGIPLDADGKPKLPEGGMTAEELQKQLAQQRDLWTAQLRKKEVEPLAETLNGLKAETETLRQEALVSAIIQAAKASGVRQEKFETLPGAPLHSAPVVAQLMGRFAWSPDQKQWAVKSGQAADGSPVFEVSSNPERQYAGAPELFERLKQDPAVKKSWFEDNRGGAAGIGGPGGGSSKIVSREQLGKMTPESQAAHFKAGGTVED
jgi:ribosomal protein L29